MIHGKPDGPQINSAFSSSISWRSMSVHDDDSSLATYLYCRIVVQVIGPPGAQASPPINWSDHLVHGLRRRPVDRTIRRSLLLNAHFVADQLTRLFVARASSPATLVTPRRSDSLCSRTKWAHFTPLHLVDIAYAGVSLLLGHR